nr:unnamed protein product [Digitaria exilis]
MPRLSLAADRALPTVRTSRPAAEHAWLGYRAEPRPTEEPVQLDIHAERRVSFTLRPSPAVAACCSASTSEGASPSASSCTDELAALHWVSTVEPCGSSVHLRSREAATNDIAQLHLSPLARRGCARLCTEAFTRPDGFLCLRLFVLQHQLLPIQAGGALLPLPKPARLLQATQLCSPRPACSSRRAAPPGRRRLPRPAAAPQAGAVKDGRRRLPRPARSPGRMDQNNACKIAVDVSSFSTDEDGTDEQLLNLMRASKSVDFIMTVDRCCHVILSEKVSQMEDESQVIDQNHELHLHIRIEGVSAAGAAVLSEYEGQEWAEEPELGVSATGPARQEEEDKEHYMEPGFDPEGDDPIGADEEWRYFKKQENVQGGSNEKVQQEKKTAKKRKAYEAIDPDAVPSDEATMMRDAPYVAHTTYDRDNPIIKEGSTFVDKKAFILIIKQYAIANEFQTRVVHSDTSRYRARCADVTCDWKVHAKKLLGCPTFMVVSISKDHTCASTSQVKGKEASKGWIADRAKEEKERRGGYLYIQEEAQKEWS